MKQFLALTFFLGSSLALTINLDGFQSIVDHVNSLDTTWKADPDFPSHLTISSFKKLMGSKKSGRNMAVLEKHQLPDSAIPEEFDAREQWPNCPSISHIRDQGVCGSCWAVSSAGAFSDRICIASNGSFTAPLSSEELLTCCDSCGDGCDGGYPDGAWDYFSTNGLVTGGDYNSQIGCQPYSLQPCEHHSKGSLPQCSTLPDAMTPKCHRQCTNTKYTNSFDKDHQKAHKGFFVSGVKEIQKELLTNGPLVAAFSVYSDFPTYKSGVYQYTTGEELGGHAVRLIGWGTENGTPYWLIANSWNTHWGENGTFKILRGKNECGIEGEITGGIPRIN